MQNDLVVLVGLIFIAACWAPKLLRTQSKAEDHYKDPLTVHVCTN